MKVQIFYARVAYIIFLCKEGQTSMLRVFLRRKTASFPQRRDLGPWLGAGAQRMELRSRAEGATAGYGPKTQRGLKLAFYARKRSDALFWHDMGFLLLSGVLLDGFVNFLHTFRRSALLVV